MTETFRTGDQLMIKTGSFTIPRVLLTVAYDTGDRIVFAGYPISSIVDRNLIVAEERMCDEEFIRLYDDIEKEGGILSHGVKRCHGAEAERVRIELTGEEVAAPVLTLEGAHAVFRVVDHFIRMRSRTGMSEWQYGMDMLRVPMDRVLKDEVALALQHGVVEQVKDFHGVYQMTKRGLGLVDLRKAAMREEAA